MSDYSDRYRSHRRPDTSDTLARVRAYLRSRPTESWLFFFAGIVAGAILG
ncbi:MAG TPA: hypothetical protein VD860_05205 [Azospirillum sp.]|nr:hypothetical protein [Azospirillum sp.]